MSYPNREIVEEKEYYIVITRKALDSINPLPMTIAIFCQFINLTLGLLVKTHFLFLYLNRIFTNFNNYYIKK